MATSNASLETLIDTTYDSVEGYRNAAEIATTPALKNILIEQVGKRQSTLDALNAELQRLGGNVVTKGTATGELHQLWLKVTSLFGDKDEAAVERIEEGEEYLAEKFAKVLASGELEKASVPVIEAALAEIRKGEMLAKRLEAQYDD